MTDKKALDWRGRKLNAKTILMLQSAERRLGERVVIIQGSFHPGVGTSAHTHDLGGVLDITPGGPTRKKVRILRKAGFAAWHRTPDQFPKEDNVGEHVHAVSIFDKNLHPEAGDQVTEYRADPPGNGLKGNAKDDGPRVPIPREPTLVKQTVKRREILFNQTNDSVGYLQDVVGLFPDRFFGPVTQGFMKARFGWNGKKPMSEKLFRKLFPSSVFKLDTTVETVVPG